MSTTPSSTVAVGTAPTSPTQLWALEYLLACDWQDSTLKIHTTFSTDVAQAFNDAEQRRGLIVSPSRIFECLISLIGPEAICYFRAFLIRAAQARFLFPIYPDELIVQSASSSQLNVLSGYLLQRRYVSGARIAVVKFSVNNRTPVSIVVTTISAMNTSTDYITTGDASFDATWAGASVFPLVEAEVLLAVSGVKILTDGFVQGSLIVNESRGPFALDALKSIGTDLGGYSYAGYPVLTIEPDWDDNSSLGYARSGIYSSNGRGKMLQLYGPQAKSTYSLQFNQLHRVRAMDLVRWFESVGGRLKPFWLLSPVNDFKIVSIDAVTVTVKCSFSAIDWTFFKTIAVRYINGNVCVRSIVSAAQSGANWVLTVSAWDTTPVIGGNLARLSLAHLVRFDTDEMIETWQTSHVMVLDTPLAVVEVFNEGAVDISGIKDFSLGYS